jgi:hypothetical protein
MLPGADFFEHYAPMYRGVLHPHEHTDAFSGACVFRLEAPSGSYCVRAWPLGSITQPRLTFIHQLLHRAASLDYVPRLVPTLHGVTWVQLQGRYWEMATWLPGRADFLAQPSSRRLEAACSALARLHLAWADVAPGSAICPAVERRLTTLAQWQRLLQQGWQPSWRADDPLAPWSQRAWAQVWKRAADVPRRLARWCALRVPVQPCHCDLWHAHVLYSGDTVTGLIDYGSAKIDHGAVDLARLLGSLVGVDAALRHAGLEAYARLRPLAAWERDLVDDLDTTGVVIAATNWLRWLYHEGRTYPNSLAVAERLARLVNRLDLMS